MKLSFVAALLLSFLVVQSHAAQNFTVSEAAGRSSELLLCDLDGDGLQDLVLVDGEQLSVFYQEPGGGFTRDPQTQFRLEPRPCLVWTMKPHNGAGGLLVMTSDGVAELVFTNRLDPPADRQLIRRSTIIPAAVEGTNVVCSPFSIETGSDWPLILVPSEQGLEVWRHGDNWQMVQLIKDAFTTRLRPVAGSSYRVSNFLNMCIADVNGDRLEDLMIRRRVGWTNTYVLYVQRPDGRLQTDPSLTYDDRAEWQSWLYWGDLNHDSHVDLIRSVWLREDSFAPGMSSGKVLVTVRMADEQGRIPVEPQQVFRKNDWTPAVPVVDVDGDGFADLVLGYSALDTREGLRKQLTARQLDYSLRVHFYRPGTGFQQSADIQRDVLIHLDRSMVLLGSSPHQFFERWVSLEGDFNGDGRRDLLVRDRNDGVSVYFFVSRRSGFSSQPDLQFSCPDPIETWQVADLNHDHISDLIVKLANRNGFRIFVSKK